MKTWLITGMGRGLGLAIARAALQAGDRVIGTVRAGRPDLDAPPDRLHLIASDLSDAAGIAPMLDQAFARFGRLDVIVNNAGFGLIGAVESPTDHDMHQLFQVDVFAPIQILRQALPRLRAQGGGHVINITSIAGRAPGAGAALYAAAKFAVEGFSAAVAQQLVHDNIRITAVAPGQFRTGFLDAARIRDSGGRGGGADAAVARLNKVNGNQPGDPDKAAQAILRIAHDPAPPLHLLLGTDALQRYAQKMQAVDAELRLWEHVTRSTDFRPTD